MQSKILRIKTGIVGLFHTSPGDFLGTTEMGAGLLETTLMLPEI
jgi:hypothetical protein